MTEAMPFLQKYDITFLRPPTIGWCFFGAAGEIRTLGTLLTYTRFPAII